MKEGRSIIISVHGIRTKGQWQSKLDIILQENEVIHKPFIFGYYDIFDFLNPWSNEKMVENFYLFYCKILEETGQIPSVVAHSFGTFLVAQSLLKRPQMKFDKVIFCGSIVSKKFHWSTLMGRNQVNKLRNEYSKLDIWARVVKRFVRKTGSSGYSGSIYKRVNFFEQRFDYGHSDYFLGNHMKEYWIPFLMESTPVFQIKHGNELSLNKYYLTLNECKKIDLECFAKDIDNLIPDNIASRWISINSDIYTFAYEVKSEKVKGYINAIPLSDTAFEKIKTGIMLDGEIAEDDIMPYVKNAELKIYFMSIATKIDVRHYRGGIVNTVAERLFAGFFLKLIDYRKNDNIKITEFAAIAWTSQGKKDL